MAASPFRASKKKRKTPVRRKWKRKLLEGLDLPLEAFGDVIRLTLIAKTDLLVENHTGLLQHTGTIIRLYTPEGILRVEGENLSMAHLGEERAYIKGTVKTVGYES